MKTIITALFITIFVFSLSFVCPIDSQKPQWKGKIEHEDGIKIILPVIPKIIDREYLYSCEDDQDTGYIMVKRYKIKNWEKILIMKSN